MEIPNLAKLKELLKLFKISGPLGILLLILMGYFLGAYWVGQGKAQWPNFPIKM